MNVSSPRFKSFAVTAGFTFWFAIITAAIGNFSFFYLLIFAIVMLTITQIFSHKVSKALDVFAIFNTKFFLGVLFIFVISIYGILFKIFRIDLLRLKKQNDSYWLDIEEQRNEKIRKQY